MKSIMEEASSIVKAIENAWKRAGSPREFSVKVLEKPEKNFFGLTTKQAKIAFLFTEEVRREERRQQPQRDDRRGRDDRRQQPSYAKAPADRQTSYAKAPADRQRGPRRRQDQRREQPQQQTRRPEKREEPRQPSYVKTTADRQTQRQEPRREESRPERGRDRQDTQRRQVRPQQDKRPEPSQGGDATWTNEMIEAVQQWTKETLTMIKQPDVTFSVNKGTYVIRLNFHSKIVSDSRQEEMLFKSWSGLAMQSVRDKFKKPLRNLKIFFGRA